MKRNLLFVEHPLPWKWESKLTEGENGGYIAGIIDANGGVITTSYWSYDAMYALWDMYHVLTEEQQTILGKGQKKRGNVSPSDGGCWFCYHKDDRPMLFSCEFDCYLHEECLMSAYLADDNDENREVQIIMKELGVIL